MCAPIVAKRLLIAVLASAVLFSGCGPPEGDLGPLSYRLKWLFNVSVVGDLYTDAEKLFEAEGLQVTVKPGGPEKDAIKELELGYAQFGVASADQVIRALAKGSPVVVIAQIFQQNPLQWIYRPDRNRFETPADFSGKTLGVTFGGNDETIMKALMAERNLSEQDVTLFSVRYDYTPFYEGRVDLWPVYRNAQGVIIEDKLRRAGETTAFFDPNAAGVRFVANSVITTRATLEQHPQTVQKFLQALLEGWRRALDPANADQVLAMIQLYDRDTPLPLLRQQLDITRQMVQPTAESVIGRIDVAAWQQTEAIMLAQNLIPAAVNVASSLLSP
ncbi:MAG: ABC transporter substrate-binding protein [Desulfobacterales bacterium]